MSNQQIPAQRATTENDGSLGAITREQWEADIAAASREMDAEFGPGLTRACIQHISDMFDFFGVDLARAAGFADLDAYMAECDARGLLA